MELKIQNIPSISPWEDSKTNTRSISAEAEPVLMNMTKVATAETVVTGGRLSKPLDLKQKGQRTARSLFPLNLLTAALSFIRARGWTQATLCLSGDRLILTAAAVPTAPQRKDGNRIWPPNAGPGHHRPVRKQKWFSLLDQRSKSCNGDEGKSIAVENYFRHL